MATNDARAELAHLANEFVDNLTTITRTVAPDCEGFRADYSDTKVGIFQEPASGIPLAFQKETLLYLKVGISGTWDLEKRFLAIEKSKIEVIAAAADSQPLFRYEYLRSPDSVPAAHLHVHAHRDALTFVMTKAGRTSKRLGRTHNGHGIPKCQDIHFPLGGHRFRPALEDILEMLIDEFGIDHVPNASEILADSRLQWRLIQTKAAVRDAPNAAAEALESLGYTVVSPETGPAMRHADRLRAF